MRRAAKVVGLNAFQTAKATACGDAVIVVGVGERHEDVVAGIDGGECDGGMDVGVIGGRRKETRGTEGLVILGDITGTVGVVRFEGAIWVDTGEGMEPKRGEVGGWGTGEGRGGERRESNTAA